jgi:hypothetical protein
MGQNNKLAGISCVCDTPFTPKLKGSRLDKIKVFAYMAVFVYLFAAFSGNILIGLATSTVEAQEYSRGPTYVVFAIDASKSMKPILETITADHNDSGFFTLNDSIDEILSNNTENKVGLVIWNTNISYNEQLKNIRLTSNETELKNTVGQINSRNIFGNRTCLADGLIEAWNILNNSSNGNYYKSIIFISDSGYNCVSKNDNNKSCQIADEIKRSGIYLNESSGICNSSNNILSSNKNISEYLSIVTKQAILQIKFEPPKESDGTGTKTPQVPPTTPNGILMQIVIPLGLISLTVFTYYFPLKNLPCLLQKPMKSIRIYTHQKKCDTLKRIRELSNDPSCYERKNITCRGDMMIKKSVTKSVIPNVITIDGNGSASEDITIEITLPTERCCIGADVAFAIDCSASMYNSDKDKKIRKAIIAPIIHKLRQDSDRVALHYWKDSKLSDSILPNEPKALTNKFNSVLSNLEASLSDDKNNFDKGGTNFEELLTGAMNSIYTDDKDGKNYTRSVIILSDAVPEGEDGHKGLKFDLGKMESAIKEKENLNTNGGKRLVFYSVGIKPHPLGSPILDEISKLGDDKCSDDKSGENKCTDDKDKRKGKFIQIDEMDLKAIDGKIEEISDELICQLIQFEKLKDIKIIDILPPYLKEPHDFRKIRKPINGRLKNDAMIPEPIVETNHQSYTTKISWDLGTIPANGDIWKLTFKARLEFPIPTNMTAMGKEDIMSQITYIDQHKQKQEISLDPGEIRFKAATE